MRSFRPRRGLAVFTAMRLEDCYLLLEVDPRASDEEVKRAHRDLTKVWHPDRFQHDAGMQRKAQEKLKSINEAYETIRAARQGSGGRWRRPDPDDEHGTGAANGWRVREGEREMHVAGLDEVIDLARRGLVSESAEVFDPSAGRWAPVRDIPEVRSALTGRRMRRYRSTAFALAALALLILVRRPSPAGLIIGIILFGVAFFLIFGKMGRTRQ